MAILQVQTRPKTSSAEQNRLRAKGILPMALITKTEGTRLIQATAEAVKAAVSEKTGLAMFDIEQDGEKTIRVVMKDVQRNPVTRRVIHMTVQEILETDVMKVNVPVKIVGEPPSVAKRAATIVIPMKTLELQAKVTSVPDSIEVNVSRMRQNDRIVAEDMPLPEGVSLLSSPQTVLAATKQMRGMPDFDDDAAFAAMDKAAAAAGA